MLASLRSACAGLALVVISVVCIPNAWLSAQLPVSQLRGVFPPAAEVGATTSIEVLGQGNLEEIDRLVFSHTGLSANVKPGESDALTGQTSVQYGKFNLSVASDLAPGFYEVRAVGRHGASYPRVFWVAPRPVISLPQPANEADPAPVLPLDRIVADRFVAARTQRYALNLTSGQRIRVAALDAKLDSRALSQMRITRPSGKAIAYARSVGTVGAVAEFTADVAGTYRVELHDSVYRGGDEFFYVVYAETVDSSSPPVDPAVAPWTNRDQLLALLKPKDGQLSMASGLAAIGVERWMNSDLAFVVAAGRQTTSVTPPCVVSGTFTDDSAGERIEFDAKKGDVFWIDVASKSLGESSDALITIHKLPPADSQAAPAKVTEQDDAPAAGSPPFRIVRSDPSLKFEAPEDARYRISVRDQLATSAASAGKRFIVAIRKPAPTFSLVAAWAYPINNQAQARPIGNNLLQGASAVLRIMVARHDGLTGAVEVFPEGLPAGVTASPIVIPADKEEGTLVFTCAEQAAGSTEPLKLIGKAVGAADGTSQVLATYATHTWEPMPSWNTLVGRLSEQALLTVNDKDTIPVSFAVGGSEPLVMARGGKLPIPISVKRRPGGADKAVLRIQGLPAKTTLADVTIEGNANEAKPEMTVAADAPLGETTAWFQVETKVKFRNNPQAYQRAEANKAELEKLLADPARAADKDKITAAIKAATDRMTALKDPTAEKEQAVFLPTNAFRIKIIEGPLEPTAAWQIEIKRGTEADHTLMVKRLVNFEAGFECKLVADANTSGIEMTAPAVAEKSNECKCHFKVAADAAPGTRKAACKLTYKFNNQDLSMTLPLVVVITE